MTCRLDSTDLCAPEPQMCVHWLLLQRVASVIPHLKTNKRFTSSLVYAEPTLVLYSNRTTLVASPDPPQLKTCGILMTTPSRFHPYRKIGILEVIRDGASCTGKRDWGRMGRNRPRSFVRDPSQHSPGVISEKKHGKPKSGWPDRESDASSVSYHCATSLANPTQKVLHQASRSKGEEENHQKIRATTTQVIKSSRVGISISSEINLIAASVGNLRLPTHLAAPLPGTMRSPPPLLPCHLKSRECRQWRDLLASQTSSRLPKFSIRLATTQECSGGTGWRLSPTRRITRVGEDSRWRPKALYILPQPSGRQYLMEAVWRVCALQVECGRRLEIAGRRRVRCSWRDLAHLSRVRTRPITDHSGRVMDRSSAAGVCGSTSFCTPLHPLKTFPRNPPLISQHPPRIREPLCGQRRHIHRHIYIPSLTLRHILQAITHQLRKTYRASPSEEEARGTCARERGNEEIHTSGRSKATGLRRQPAHTLEELQANIITAIDAIPQHVLAPCLTQLLVSSAHLPRGQWRPLPAPTLGILLSQWTSTDDLTSPGTTRCPPPPPRTILQRFAGDSEAIRVYVSEAVAELSYVLSSILAGCPCVGNLNWDFDWNFIANQTRIQLNPSVAFSKWFSEPRGKPGSIPSRVAAGYSHVPDDAAGQRIFSGISRLTPSLHSRTASYSSHFPLIGYQDSVLRGAKISQLHSRMSRNNDTSHMHICFGGCIFLTTDFLINLCCDWGRSGSAARAFASHEGEPGIVPDDTTGRRVFSGSPALSALPFRRCSTLILLRRLQDADVKSYPNIPIVAEQRRSKHRIRCAEFRRPALLNGGLFRRAL
ncbi:hypothetical protein PR048_026045 [Dryococelus australis]|uniref:Uncharacterized protein n=1 Tax=Dryococelus australis TaxID=614101 RepID=A0ABQ9GK84_9NEOP|nr:hypothetical protein PR048_026045 [Dryococelus australis]